MKKLLLLALLAPFSLFGQTARYDMPVLPTTPHTVPVGSLPAVLAVTNATVSVCAFPATIFAGMCTNKITTYTDSTGTTACPATAQLTAPGSSVCTSTTGLQGALGFWYAATSTHLTYTVKTTWGAFGPYDISPSIGAAGNPAAPGFAVQFANSGASAFQADSNVTVDPAKHTFNAAAYCSANGSWNVFCSGASGNGTTDDTTAVQTAITYANSVGLDVYFPAVAHGYNITKSLNITAMGSMNLRGNSNRLNSSGKSTLLDNLTQASSMLDFTGCAHCGTFGLSLAWQTGSLSTAEIFAAATTAQAGANGGGNYFREDDTDCYYGGASTGACAVIYHTDQFFMTGRTWNNALNGAGAVVGDTLGTATAVTSRYQTVCTSCDSFTYAVFDPTTETTTEGGAVAPLQLTGSQSYLLDGYCARGPGSSAGACVEVSNSGAIENNSIHTNQFRVEDQSGTSNAYCAIKYDAGATWQKLKGAILNVNSTSGSAGICGGTSAGIGNVDDSLTVTGGPAFNFGAAITQGTIQVDTSYIGANSFGTINSSAGAGLMHNLNVYETKSVNGVTDTANTILAGIYGNATSAFFNSGGKICGPNPIGSASRYCITAQQEIISATNPTPSANSVTIPVGYGQQYFYNNGTTTVPCTAYDGLTSGTSGSILNFGLTNSDSGCVANSQYDFTTFTQIKTPGGDVLNHSDTVCYFDGSAYHNCPSVTPVNHGIVPVALSVVAVPANTVAFGPMLALTAGTFAGNSGYVYVSGFTCAVNPVLQLFDQTSSTGIGSATITGAGANQFATSGTISPGDLLYWRFTAGTCTALTLSGSAVY